MQRETIVSRPATLRVTTLLITAVAIGIVSLASAQYQSSYPYAGSRRPDPRLPNSAQRVGGFTGNPYRKSQVAPTGLPLGGARTHSYYGSAGGARGNPAAHRPVQKPFSNIQRPRPLITSQDAARISIAQGLWRY